MGALRPDSAGSPRDRHQHRDQRQSPPPTWECARSFSTLPSSCRIRGRSSGFAEHAVVLPVVVITELEAKRHHPELGYFARSALRALDDLRVQHGTLDQPIPVNDAGGTVRVELNHTDQNVLPSGFRWATTTPASSRSRRTCAPRATPSPWCPRTCRCASRHPRWAWRPRSTAPNSRSSPGWTGMREIQLDEEQMAELWDTEAIAAPDPEECGEDVAALARAHGPGDALAARFRARTRHRRGRRQAGARRP